jgi:hypothetical protein
MDALKIALETVFVGALALPWLALAAQLFFPQFSLSKTENFEGWVTRVWSIQSEVIGYTVVGVLSVAMAYTVGAAVSRLAGDFFNDDDLLPHFPTEDQIRTSVYCDPSESKLVHINVPSQDSSETCRKVTPRWFPKLHPHYYESSAADQTRQIFALQETSLLLAGEDKVSRLRLLRQQTIVLQGVAFDGVLTSLLCLIGWNATRSWGRWRWLVPAGLLFWSAVAFGSHFHLFPNSQGAPVELNDPPLLELAWLLLAVSAGYAVWKEAKASWPQGTGWVSFLFAALAFAGWYWTEILYDRLIIYSFYVSHYPLIK